MAAERHLCVHTGSVCNGTYERSRGVRTKATTFSPYIATHFYWNFQFAIEYRFTFPGSLLVIRTPAERVFFVCAGFGWIQSSSAITRRLQGRLQGDLHRSSMIMHGAREICQMQWWGWRSSFEKLRSKKRRRFLNSGLNLHVVVVLHLASSVVLVNEYFVLLLILSFFDCFAPSSSNQTIWQFLSLILISNQSMIASCCLPMVNRAQETGAS